MLLKPRPGRRQGHARCTGLRSLPGRDRRARRGGPRLVRRRHAAFVERLVTTPRHIEIQVMADGHGNAAPRRARVLRCSAGTRRSSKRHRRRCSRPSSAEMGRAACEAARAVGYTGAGTVEFIVRRSSHAIRDGVNDWAIV
ncbi:hypothetical protein HBB16_11045 [Pseudonocardia sp. MCCB 268]|nr:hypothetical protein [Pseudonocardia cytotoxica]